MTQWTPRLLRGTWRYRPSLCVAGVALMALGWLWWRAWFPGVAGATHHLSHTTLSHTPSFTHQLSHTIFHTHHLSHTIFDTPSFTHHFVTHHLSHTTLSHTIFHHTTFHTHTTLSHTIFHHTSFHTQLCHTPSFTHNFVTHTHTIFLCHTPSFTYDFVPHTTVFTSRSFTTNFVVPSFPIPLQHLLLLIGRS